jgi:short-subunit dehydrogenase
MGHRRTVAGSRLLITGASQGIGRALAEAAVARGARVLATARSAELLKELEASAKPGRGGALVTLVADVTSDADRRRTVDALVEHFGGLDVLVNNAGIGATGRFADADPGRLRQIMEVNVFGLCETTRLCLPLLKQGADPLRACPPAIVNVSSIVGKRGIPGRSEYSASKFAVQGFSEALRAELVVEGIDVIVVNPGLTQTNFPKNMLERKSRLEVDHLRGMTPEQVAAATLRALQRGSHEITLTWQGKLLVIVSRFFPRLVDRIAAWRVKKLYREN